MDVVYLCRAPQVRHERVDRSRFRFHDPELADVRAEVREDLFAPRAARLGDVLLDQRFEMLEMRLHRLRLNATDVDELVVIAIHEVAIEIEHVREPAREPRTEIDTGAPEHAHDTARHVLAAVIARALD